VSFARRDCEGRFDSASRGGEERRVLGRVACPDHVGKGVEPEGSFERALHGESAVHAVGNDAGRVGNGAGDVARGDERGEHGVARFDAQCEEPASDVLSLGLRGDVAHDAVEVARVHAVRQCLRETLALEDRDAVDDGVEGMTRGGDADVALGVEQPEAREVGVEEQEYIGAAPGLQRASGALLTLGGFSQLATCLLDLLVGRRIGVEVDA